MVHMIDIDIVRYICRKWAKVGNIICLKIIQRQCAVIYVEIVKIIFHIIVKIKERNVFKVCIFY